MTITIPVTIRLREAGGLYPASISPEARSHVVATIAQAIRDRFEDQSLFDEDFADFGLVLDAMAVGQAEAP